MEQEKFRKPSPSRDRHSLDPPTGSGHDTGKASGLVDPLWPTTDLPTNNGSIYVIIYLPVGAGGCTTRRKLRMPQGTKGRSAYHERSLRQL